MSNTAPSRADPVVVFPLSRWCPPQETSQPHPPQGGVQCRKHATEWSLNSSPPVPHTVSKSFILHILSTYFMYLVWRPTFIAPHKLCLIERGLILASFINLFKRRPKWIFYALLLCNIGSDNGLSYIRHQAIIWTNAGLLSIGPLGRNFIFSRGDKLISSSSGCKNSGWKTFLKFALGSIPTIYVKF